MRLGISPYAPAGPAPRMPPGLVELMEGLSREVLRHNPPDLHQFCADHMQRLLLLRARREGRTRAMTLEEKIARAQKTIRQRAEKRRRRFDEPDQQSPGYSDEEETVDDDAKITPPLGLSPRVTKPMANEIEHHKDDAREENTSSGSVDIAEREDAVGVTETDISPKEVMQEIVVDDAKSPKSKETETIVSVQHVIENEKNINNLVDEKDKNNLDKTPTSVTEESEAKVSPLIHSEDLVIDELLAPSQEVMQECDEFPIENHIFERDELKENEATNEAAKNPFSDATIEIVKKSVESRVVIQTGVDIADHGISHGKEIVAIIAEPETLNEEKNSVAQIDKLSDKKIENKETNSENVATVIQQENLPIKTINAGELTTEVDIKEQKPENNTQSIPDDLKILKTNNLIDTKPSDNESMSEKEIATDAHEEVKSQHKEDTHMEKIYYNNNESKLENSVENDSGVKHLAVKENYEQMNNEFETVTIEVKAPTPSPELELGHESSDQQYADGKDCVISTMNVPEENKTLDPGNENTQKDNKNDIEIKVQETVENEVTKSNIEIIELEIEPKILDDNALIENEIIIAKSSSNEDKADSSSDNITKENIPVEAIENNSAHDTEKMSYISAPGHDIDINALEKSDSANDITIEDTTESNSETNTEVDESNNPATMDLETAAVTIQKVFRTFLFKSRASTLDDVSNGEGSMDVGLPEDMILDQGEVPKQEDELANVKERRALGITRMDTVLQTVNEEKSLSLSTDDSSTLSSAATTIQAHVRGFLVRNRLHSNKTASISSLVNSDGHSSLDVDNEQQKCKTVLNIHIVPEGHFMSRDESIAMSLDLPLDSSPPTSLSTLNPLSYDVSEKRKLLKREDAIQSISPPSNNSGKQSEDSGKEISIAESDVASTQRTTDEDIKTDVSSHMEHDIVDLSPSKSVTAENVLEKEQKTTETRPSSPDFDEPKCSSVEPSADEMDVVTPFVLEKAKVETPRLLHSGECHDVVLPTCVSRSETAVVREFKNVLGYFLLWNTAS